MLGHSRKLCATRRDIQTICRHLATCAIIWRMDETDRMILRELSANARASLEAVGRAVHLAPSSVKRRIERLESDGVIRGYTVVVNRRALEAGLDILMEVYVDTGVRRPALVQTLAAQPEIVRAWSVAGEADAMALVRVRDTDDLERMVLRLQETGTIARTKSQVLFSDLVSRDA
ncbi:MAG: Lrp/AsnC family transcriptional regulator [Nocardioidaceae bacterium]